MKHMCVRQSCVFSSVSNDGSTKLDVDILHIDALYHPHCFATYFRLIALDLPNFERACARDDSFGCVDFTFFEFAALSVALSVRMPTQFVDLILLCRGMNKRFGQLPANGAVRASCMAGLNLTAYICTLVTEQISHCLKVAKARA